MRTDKSIITKHRNLMKPPGEIVTKVKSKVWDSNYDRIDWKTRVSDNVIRNVTAMLEEATKDMKPTWVDIKVPERIVSIVEEGLKNAAH